MQQRTSSNAIARLICTGLLLLLLTVGYFLFVPMHTGHPGPSDRSICRNNLKQIWIATESYTQEHGRPPPAYTVDEEGNRLHSWRTLLLPYLEQEALYESIDLTRPWNDPVNANAYNTVVDIYRCPATEGVPSLHTSYLAITGESFVITGDDRRKYLPANPGDKPAIIEMPRGYTVHWMSPEDITPAELLKLCDPEAGAPPGEIPVIRESGAIEALTPAELGTIIADPS